MRVIELFEKDWVRTREVNFIPTKLFYIQPIDAKCAPGSFGCDLATHHGTEVSVKEFANRLLSIAVGIQGVKILDEHGTIVDIISR